MHDPGTIFLEPTVRESSTMTSHCRSALSYRIVENTRERLLSRASRRSQDTPGRDETSVTSTMKRVIHQTLHARGNVKRRGCWASQQQQQQERRRRQRRPSLAWECDIIPRSVSACAAGRGISAERPPLLDLVVSRHVAPIYIPRSETPIRLFRFLSRTLRPMFWYSREIIRVSRVFSLV